MSLKKMTLKKLIVSFRKTTLAFLALQISGLLVIPQALSQNMGLDIPTVNPYSFKGGVSACSSQGAWTENAILMAKQIRGVVLQLRDDPNCKALNASMQTALIQLSDEVEKVQQEPQKVSEISQLNNEVSALTQEVQKNGLGLMSPAQRTKLFTAAAERNVKMAGLSAKVGAANASANLSSPDSIPGMADYGKQIRNGARKSMQLLNQVVTAIPSLSLCLVGENQQAFGNLITGVTQIASSLSKSGQDPLGKETVSTISKLTDFLREQKFNSGLRRLNQQDFTSSIACLLEVTAESYCNAYDSMGLFEKNIASIQKGYRDLLTKKQFNAKDTNPFVGFYVLNTHVPNITNWMQKIQIGVEPKLPTDATFQNKILQDITNYYKTVKITIGLYNSTVATIQAYRGEQEKRTALIQLITELNDNLVSSVGDNRNFFTQLKVSAEIPFFLLNMPVPPEIYGKTEGSDVRSVPIDFRLLLQGDYARIPNIDNPLVVATGIGTKLQQLIAETNVLVINYFSKWFIVDKPKLVNEAFIDINYSVFDSMTAVYNFLEVYMDRVEKYKADDAWIPVAKSLHQQLRITLDEFEIIREMGKSFRERGLRKQLTPEDAEEMQEKYTHLINTVYTQFEVMLARSGYIANRMIDIVYSDYIILIKNKVDFTEYQEDLFIAQGRAAFDRMMTLMNGMPTAIETDLIFALSKSKDSIGVLEELFRDNMISIIAEQRMIEEEKDIVALDSVFRIFADSINETKDRRLRSYRGLPFLDKIEYSFPTVDVTGLYTLFNVIFNGIFHSDRYPMVGRSITFGFTAPQGKYNEASRLRGQLCIQSLAFHNQVVFLDVCNGTGLTSPFVRATEKSKLTPELLSLNVDWRQEVSRHMANLELTVRQRRAQNLDSRICAFRDYHRRNMVHFMTSGKED